MSAAVCMSHFPVNYIYCWRRVVERAINLLFQSISHAAAENLKRTEMVRLDCLIVFQSEYTAAAAAALR